MNYSNLDNPIWKALSQSQQKFARIIGRLKCYDPEICPFGAFEGDNNVANDIDNYSKIIDDFFIVGDIPKYSDKVKFAGELVCLQMICETRINITPQEEIIYLNNKYEDEVLKLVSLGLPGYFRKRTMELGDYFGIFKNEALVAVTGERMKMNGFTEVSAVVTHPDHLGKGYAKQLIAHTVNKIFDKNEIPFLHVAESNVNAISVYDKLGFRTRTKIDLWRFTKI
jgi:ribosomal protein S18 acetylase RimI-like enzyme